MPNLPGPFCLILPASPDTSVFFKYPLHFTVNLFIIPKAHPTAWWLFTTHYPWSCGKHKPPPVKTSSLLLWELPPSICGNLLPLSVGAPSLHVWGTPSLSLWEPPPPSVRTPSLSLWEPPPQSVRTFHPCSQQSLLDVAELCGKCPFPQGPPLYSSIEGIMDFSKYFPLKIHKGTIYILIR